MRLIVVTISLSRVQNAQAARLLCWLIEGDSVRVFILHELPERGMLGKKREQH